MIYEQGVKEYVLFYKVNEKGKRKLWFNRKCERAKKRRDEAWRRMKRKLVQKRKEEYKLGRKEYVRVRREEKRYEKDVVYKCKEKPKLFYRLLMKK